MGLLVVIAAALGLGRTARAQAPEDDAPRVIVEGQPVGEAPPPAPDGVRVTITADSPDVRLMRVDDDRDTEVCAPPCGAIVPRQGLYQIAGDGVVRTGKFAVPKDRADLHLNVDSGSNLQRRAGIAIGILGYATVLAGETYLSYERSANVGGASSHARDITFGMVASGLVVGTVGLVLIFTASTHVTTSSGERFSHAAPPGRRTPRWSVGSQAPVPEPGSAELRRRGRGVEDHLDAASVDGAAAEPRLDVRGPQQVDLDRSAKVRRDRPRNVELDQITADGQVVASNGEPALRRGARAQNADLRLRDVVGGRLPPDLHALAPMEEQASTAQTSTPCRRQASARRSAQRSVMTSACPTIRRWTGRCSTARIERAAAALSAIFILTSGGTRTRW